MPLLSVIRIFSAIGHTILFSNMLGELLNENEVLAGMIIDLGLIPVELCTPTLMSKINEEIYAKAESEY